MSRAQLTFEQQFAAIQDTYTGRLDLLEAALADLLGHLARNPMLGAPDPDRDDLRVFWLYPTQFKIWWRVIDDVAIPVRIASAHLGPERERPMRGR